MDAKKENPKASCNEKESENLQRLGDDRVTTDKSADAPAQRPTWSGQMEFILASVGYAVGLGNVWRFPYLCYSSGGGAFIIPYLTMVTLCGIPLLFMEFAIGQYSRLGPVHAFSKICPLLKGVGVATVVISFVFSTYYNVLMSWALYYLFNSFGASLPWMSCNNTWNVVENCSSGLPGNVTHLQSSSQQFFDHNLLEKTGGIEEAGGLRWELYGCLLATWAIIYLCIFRGVKSTGKVVYFTAVFPYFILFAMLINNVQLPGAKTGILYFVKPVWGKLLEMKVWVNAAAQVFNSLGIAFGCMISNSSYNKFNNNFLRDALIVSSVNVFTSILAGFVIFSAIGYMGHIHNLPVEKIATDETRLSACFFVCVFFLQFGNVEVVITFLKDEFGSKVLRFLKKEELLVLAVCIVSSVLGIPHVTKGGIYVFQLMDHYTAVVSLVFLAMFEVVAVCWVFGVSRLSLMVRRMRGKSPNIYFRYCWLLFCPLLLLCILTSSIVQYAPPRYGDYIYPVWAEWMGWGISLVSIVWIPLGAVHEIYRNKGSFLQRLKTAVSPTLDLDSEDFLPGKQSLDNPLSEKLFTSAV